MSKHLAYRFDGYAISVCYSGGKGVAGKVRGYAFLDAQCGGYLFEVEVVFGVAQHGQEIAVNAGRLVLFQD